MPKARPFVTSCLALACLSMSAPTAASAAGWMVNHNELTSSSKLATSFLSSQLSFNVPEIPLTLTCNSKTIGDLNFSINPPADGLVEHFIFLGCEIPSPEGCTTGPTITTFATLLTELTLDGALGVKGEIKPTEKFGFAQFAVSGTSCAVASDYFIQGTLGLLLPSGQDERTLQALLISDAGKLKIGLHPATAHFTWLVPLSLSSQTWSFL